MRSGRIVDRLDEGLSFFGALHGSRLGQKAALADDFQQFAGCGKGEGHGGGWRLLVRDSHCNGAVVVALGLGPSGE